jgi:hypothetical protein
MDLESEGNLEETSINKQIDDCHRQIEAQCERLARQIRGGQPPHESRLVLLCLHRTVAALTKSRNSLMRHEEFKATDASRAG